MNIFLLYIGGKILKACMHLVSYCLMFRGKVGSHGSSFNHLNSLSVAAFFVLPVLILGFHLQCYIVALEATYAMMFESM